ncbi:RHS repeat-associated core domain-containing protein [Maridesulfovibrio ferrireducens]|uniref:RHS repeat-associated core domain-containing protein n=1 Tax=Maridesulfovibrio ferrireducens TaxID=246191 RepID=A0A1G9D555_9BACT|nr:RHS repeat-associated core domain-containing protein [Maridesulfovibrio ferrireducens]SDK59052.1 RHS repeat-associated core domain-containing protein [Maridesulfovibrio ferrireducens]
MCRGFFFGDPVVVFMVADERGNEVKRIIYDSFGNLLFDSNEKFDTCVGFSAGLADKDTGLVHFGYREYDPAIGRFITPDPIGFAGGDVDVYGYCLDDPINFVDRTGLMGYVPRIAQCGSAIVNTLDPSRPSWQGAALNLVVDAVKNQDLDENIKKIQEGRFKKRERRPVRTDLRKSKNK